jgi:hypothetical protein
MFTIELSARTCDGRKAETLRPLPIPPGARPPNPKRNQPTGDNGMKIRKTGLTFVSGVFLGLSLALGLGAVQKTKEAPAKETQPVETLKPDWARLKFMAYPNGATGIFDPDTGMFYMYDINLDRCYLIRELVALGDPLRRP